jgi:hypothetical protein
MGKCLVKAVPVHLVEDLLRGLVGGHHEGLGMRIVGLHPRVDVARVGQLHHHARVPQIAMDGFRQAISPAFEAE